MLPSAHVLGAIFLRTAVIYAVVLAGVRLSGKREVGQMTPFDLTLLLLLSNAVQNAMTGPDTSLIGGVVAAATLLVLNYLVAEVSGGNRRFRKFVQGQPSLLVHDGEVIFAIMYQQAGLALNKLSETPIAPGDFCDQIIQHQQRGRRDHASDERCVRPSHRVLHCVAEQQKKGEIEGRHLPDLALAAETYAREDDRVDHGRPQKDRAEDVGAWKHYGLLARGY